MQSVDVLDSNGRIRDLAAPTVMWVSTLTLCGLVPLWIVSNTPSDGDGSWWLAGLVAVLAGARFSWLLGLGRAQLMEFSFWTFTYIFLGLAPLVQLRTSTYPGTTPGLVLDLNQPAMVISLTGALAVLAGVCLPGRVAGERPRPERLNQQRVIGLAVCALLSNAYYVATVGPAVFLESRAALGEVGVTGNAVLNAVLVSMARVPLLVSFLALLAVRRGADEHRRKLLTTLAILTGAAALFSVNPISSARYSFGTFALAIVAGMGAYATPARVRAMSATLLVGLVAVFPLADAFRRSATANVDLARDTNPFVTLTTGDFDAYAQLNNTLLYVNEAGITWGRQALGVLLFWVPRDVWSTKPVDTGMLLAQFRGYTFGNLSAPLWAEFYINFGAVGVVVGMFGLGLLIRRSDLRTSTLLTMGRSPSILALILPFYLIMLLRGSLLQAMAFLTVMTACTYFLRGSMTRSPRPPFDRHSDSDPAR